MTVYLLCHGATPILVLDSVTEARGEAEAIDADLGEFTLFRFNAETISLDPDEEE